MQCEICGKDTILVKVIIESIELNVCSNCAKFGSVIKIPPKFVSNFGSKPKINIIDQPEEEIVNNYGSLRKNAREKLGLRQEELALKLNEKHTLIHKWECNELKPTIEAEKKLEKFFGIKLISIYKKVDMGKQKNSQELTIGDIIKF